MTTRTGRWGFGILATTALLTTLQAARYYAVLFNRWPMIDATLQEVIRQFPWRSLTHMLVAPIALLVGPLQFIPGLRARRPRLHRYVGRVYVAACLIAGAAGLLTALHASGGPVAGWGFGILAVLWIAITAWGWRAAVRGQISLHRRLMRFSYAMSFAAVTLRLQIPLGFALGYRSYPAMSVWLAWTSWIPNLIAVAVYSGYASARATRAPATPAETPGTLRQTQAS